ncbi:hypothetical protein [Saccharopolyspora karakumensis]|nr:hypothetical protein [Saccharopolyspora karakumensis]
MTSAIALRGRGKLVKPRVEITRRYGGRRSGPVRCPPETAP